MRPLNFGRFLTGEHLEKFWSRVDILGHDECWAWLWSRHGFGYGQMSINGKTHLCHKLAYMDCNWDVPGGMVVRHKCDNPACCNPAHLEIGTQKDNLNDAVERGRLDRGAHHRKKWIRIAAETKAKRLAEIAPSPSTSLSERFD